MTVDKLAANSVFQSTLPGWEATMAEFVFLHSVTISIHAPRMGSDGLRVHAAVIRDGISIHAPRMGSDLPKTSS